jgi:NADPH2:quinone reductase
MLYRTAKAQKGETVLIHSGAGGVGTALIQLGKLLELKMLATASTSKLELVKNLGAIPIDYTKEDFTQRVRELVPEGIDAVFDAIGGSSFTRSFNCLKPKGRFIGYGFTSKMNSPFWGRLDTFTRFGLMKLFPRGREATFYGIMFVKAAHPDWFKEDLTHLFNLLEQGKIDPIVNSVFPLEQARQAHELMESRQVMGKIVLIVNN